MERWGCVEIRAFPLQLLLNAHPDWACKPCAVVEDDKPQALVRFVNARAFDRGVRPGQRYGTALGLARDLHASPISSLVIARHVRAITKRLRRYSPHVEPSADTPGVFWLDARGLDRLYASLHDWAQAIRLDVRRVGLQATVAVGFTRFGVYALTKCHQGIIVCAGVDEERAAIEQAPLSSIDLEPDALARLAALGIETLGAFLRLPGDGIAQRFGSDALALHRLASGYQWAPLIPVPAEEPWVRLVHFDAPEAHVERLLFTIKRLLDSLLAVLARKSLAVGALELWMKLDDRQMRTETVRPAAPTLDVPQLLTLVRLRLDGLRLSSGITTLRITATACPAASAQSRLFPHYAQRDPDLANQAFARLRAEFGERAVVRARMGDAHLPDAQFAWEPLDRLPLRASPVVVTTRPLVRRIYAQPLPLPPNFSLTAHTASDAVEAQGPYAVSGGWWSSTYRRDYYLTFIGDGDWQWMYYDHGRQRFFLQGRVE